AANAARVPIVQTLHNYRLLCPAATFYRDSAVCEECLGKLIAWPAVRHACYRNSRSASAVTATMLAFHRVRRTYQERVQRYIALSDFARDKFIAAGMPAEKIDVRPNYLLTDVGAGRGDGDFALFVGRLSSEKGVDVLLRAWELVGD